MKFKDHFGALGKAEKAAVEGLLERYKGHLRVRQVAVGIQIVLANARSLYEDALALLSMGRVGRSMSMMIASMEEIGKVSVLSSMSRIPSNNQKLWADAWERFRSHEHKSTRGVVDSFPHELRVHPAILMTVACQQYSLAGVAERMRQYGLYTDFHAAEKRWLSPGEVTKADVELWRKRVEAALTRIEGFAALGLYSEKSLAIQQEVYAGFYARKPRRKNLSSDDVATSIDEGPELAKTYFRRLIEEGVIDPNTDIKVFGIPMNELLRDAIKDA